MLEAQAGSLRISGVSNWATERNSPLNPISPIDTKLCFNRRVIKAAGDGKSDRQVRSRLLNFQSAGRVNQDILISQFQSSAFRKGQR